MLGLPASLGEVTVEVLWEVETIKTGGSMKVDNFTRILLTIIAVALSVIAIRPFFPTPTVSAQSNGVKYGYLAPLAVRGDDGMAERFLDYRTGSVWECSFSICSLNGRYPVEQIK